MLAQVFGMEVFLILNRLVSEKILSALLIKVLYIFLKSEIVITHWHYLAVLIDFNMGNVYSVYIF